MNVHREAYYGGMFTENNAQRCLKVEDSAYTSAGTMRISMNHNSLGCKQPLGLDVEQSPNV
jgi:hypothetical protein